MLKTIPLHNITGKGERTTPKLSKSAIQQKILAWTITLGQFVPNLISHKYGSGGISSVAVYRSEQLGAVCQGCIAPPFIGGLPLTGGPGCSIFAARRGYPPEPPPFPRLGKGWGLG